MNDFKALVFQNPMLIDMKRAYRRFFGVSRMKAMNAAVLVLACILYGILILITVAYRTAFSPQALVHVQTFLICFTVPSVMHGAIAAEREKRTWDLLLVAPVSNAQIVIGKFIGGVVTLFAVVGLMLIPTLIAFDPNGSVDFMSLLKSEVVSIFFGVLLVALSLTVSARTKRTYSAQIGIYGLLVMALIVWPILAAAMGSQGIEPLLHFLNPFYAIAEVWNQDVSSYNYEPYTSMHTEYRGLYNGWIHMILYSILTSVLLMFTIAKLKALDDEGVGRRGNAKS